MPLHKYKCSESLKVIKSITPGHCVLLPFNRSPVGYTAAMKPNIRKDHSHAFLRRVLFLCSHLFSPQGIWFVTHTSFGYYYILYIKNVSKVASVVIEWSVTTQRQRTTFWWWFPWGQVKIGLFIPWPSTAETGQITSAKTYPEPANRRCIFLNQNTILKTYNKIDCAVCLKGNNLHKDRVVYMFSL